MSSTLSYTEEVLPIETIKEDEEFKSLVPPNNSKEDLERSLKEKSQIFPLITDKNYVLIDGHTRLDIMRKLKFKKVKILKYDFDSQQERDLAYELIWSFNGVRRQLDKNEKLAFFQRIADNIAKFRVSKNKTEESKIESHATQFSETESKQIQESDELLTLEDATVIKAKEYERILKELDKENEALSSSEKHKMAILRINAPWLLKYVINQKYKVPLDQAFRIYTRAKDLGILDKLKDLAQAFRDPLITTKEGRKIILNDEYKDLLEKILSKQYTAERAISEVKQKESSKRGGKRTKKATQKEDDKEETSVSVQETEEYPMVEERQQAAKEEEQVPQENVKNEVKIVKNSADTVLEQVNIIRDEMFNKTSLSKIKDELSDKEIQRLVSVWENFATASVSVSNYFWFNAVPILRRYITEEEIEKVFYEFAENNIKFYKWDEIHYGELDYNKVLKKFNEEFYGEKGGE